MDIELNTFRQFEDFSYNVVVGLYHCSNTGRGWYNVVLHPLEQLQLLLIGGHPSATDDRCFVWPMSTSDSVCPSHIQTITSRVKTISNMARFVCPIFVCVTSRQVVKVI